jgi:hypothetical protein
MDTDDTDKRIRRSALKLVALSLAVGFMLGLAVGVTVAYNTIDRVLVIPLPEGVEV